MARGHDLVGKTPVFPFLLIQNVIVLLLWLDSAAELLRASRTDRSKWQRQMAGLFQDKFILACTTCREHLSGCRTGSGARERSSSLSVIC